MDFITAKHITESKADTETMRELVPELMNKEGTCYSRFIPSIFLNLITYYVYFYLKQSSEKNHFLMKTDWMITGILLNIDFVKAEVQGSCLNCIIVTYILISKSASVMVCTTICFIL